MRSVRRDVVSFLEAFILPSALVVSFPFYAVSYKPSAQEAGEPFTAAFVTLSPEEESAAMRVAKSSWQRENVRSTWMRVDLSAGALPEPPAVSVMDSPDATRAGRRISAAYGMPPMSPSEAAPPPATIPPMPAVRSAQPFARDELLTLDGEKGMKK